MSAPSLLLQCQSAALAQLASESHWQYIANSEKPVGVKNSSASSDSISKKPTMAPARSRLPADSHTPVRGRDTQQRNGRNGRTHADKSDRVFNNHDGITAAPQSRRSRAYHPPSGVCWTMQGSPRRRPRKQPRQDNGDASWDVSFLERANVGAQPFRPDDAAHLIKMLNAASKSSFCAVCWHACKAATATCTNCNNRCAKRLGHGQELIGRQITLGIFLPNLARLRLRACVCVLC